VVTAGIGLGAGGVDWTGGPAVGGADLGTSAATVRVREGEATLAFCALRGRALFVVSSGTATTRLAIREGGGDRLVTGDGERTDADADDDGDGWGASGGGAESVQGLKAGPASCPEGAIGAVTAGAAAGEALWGGGPPGRPRPE
jgi:hypothetical protein